MPFIQFQFRRGTASEWTTSNPVLAQGEIGIETDTNLFKIGNGTSTWSALPYGGMQGIQGRQGVQGTQGTQGAQGIQGIQGTTGSQGIQGTQGTTGSQGIQGVQGTTGSQGIQGTQGTTGATGSQGIQGTQGTTGTTGNTGTQGTTGATGSQGIQGTQGTTGTQGIQGTQGTTGSTGTQGATGSTGTQGTTGAQGIQGTQGTTGTQGITGTQGTTGSTGTQGTAGPSTVINAASVASGTYYPVLVGGTGTNQTASASTSFSINTATNVLSVTATAARYSDLAENYVADAPYAPGTVLMVGGSQEVTLADRSGERIAGIVSTAPAHLMNGGCEGEHVVAIALTGRVPALAKGPINKGDFIYSAGEGYVMGRNKKISYLQCLGLALSDFNENKGIVEVMVGKF